jgi:hypothetical protein
MLVTTDRRYKVSITYNGRNTITRLIIHTDDYDAYLAAKKRIDDSKMLRSGTITCRIGSHSESYRRSA